MSSPPISQAPLASTAVVLDKNTDHLPALQLTSSGKTRFGRWYDATPELAYALDLLQLLPLTHRTKLLQNLITQMQQHQPNLEHWLAARERQNASKQGWVASASLPHRWYDDDPLLIKLLAYLVLFSPVLRQFYAKQLLNLIHAI